MDKVEFRCPHCFHDNTVECETIKEMYHEHIFTCARCKHPVDVICADGPNDSLNVIASCDED
ncbi:hypothetical protein [Aestuariibacter salexigens]|uniref:hypothetical protein n=1 Tax=Aestuariibacter salexigens TaxID=226010 RepID=UPI0003F4E968|nr:hypothetical protein [Aestuariibacter salexigens]